jgi:hypothetical protein
MTNKINQYYNCGTTHWLIAIALNLKIVPRPVGMPRNVYKIAHDKINMKLNPEQQVPRGSNLTHTL